jgi:hypothetical protein
VRGNSNVLTRTVLLRSALLPVLLAGTVVAAASGATPVAGDARSCGDALRALATRWGGTGAWRTLAPYPVPREASPTDSAGVWLERWTLSGGSIELRRVSAVETRVARVDGAGCAVSLGTFRRTYDRAAMVQGFTDDALRDLLQRNARGMIYVWSPGMPLSIRGLAEARAAAGTLGVAFTAVMADARDGAIDSLVVTREDARSMESVELVYRNATVHYPALVLYRDGRMIDGVVPGYKSRGAYAELAGALLARPSFERAATESRSDAATPAFWVDHRARITMRSSVPTPRDIGFFFKPVGATSLVSYTSRDRAYLFDLVTRKEIRIPGHVDPVPTPDGRFLTRPGLVVHPIPALTRGDASVIYTDEELPDEYQTASILRETRGAVRYRIVTGWHETARFRDYDVTLGPGEMAVFRPAGRPFVPCESRSLSLPINAKSGREFGAFDVRRGTNGIIEVMANGTCQDRLDLGFASGKLSFSYDGKQIAFSTSRINVDTAGALMKPSETFYKDALVLQRSTGRIASLTRNRPLQAHSFPEFLPDGAIMLLDQQAPGSANGLLRVLTVK